MATPEELAAEAQTIAVEQSKPEKFSFMERLRGRNLPEDTVDFYLGEDIGYKIQRVEEELSNTTNKDKVKALEDLLVELKEIVKSQTYKINLRGITNEQYDALVKEVEAEYPTEYNEYQNPFTGKKIKEPIENEDREKLWENTLWQACITSVEDPEGNVDDEVTLEMIATLRAHGPMDGLRRVAQTIAKLRMANDWMDHIQDEDFFPKP